MASHAEGAIQKELVKHLKKQPLVAWIDRANSGKTKVKGGWMQLHEVGTPDLIGYSTSCVFIGIEVKDEDKYKKKNHSLSDEQIARLNDIRERGGICGVACCIEHVDEILKGVHVGMDDLV